MNLHKLLLLETSEKTGQVGLAEDGTLIREQKLDGIKRRSSDLAEVVALLISQQGWSLKQLTGIVVGQGPGSFTGLRVGIISAKVLAYALKIPLFAIPTFETLAYQAPATITRISVIADALKKNVYTQSFQRDTSEFWVEHSPLRIIPFETWKESLNSDTSVTGPGLTTKGLVLDGLSMLESHRWYPKLETMVRQVIARPDDYFSDFWKVEPLYGRGSSAEEKLELSQVAK